MARLEDVDWALGTPQAVRALVRGVDGAVRGCRARLAAGWQLLQRSYVQSPLELRELARGKADRAFAAGLRGAVLEAAARAAAGLAERAAERQRAFAALEETGAVLKETGAAAPEQGRRLRALRQEGLAPALAAQVEALKRVQRCRNEARGWAARAHQQAQALADRARAAGARVREAAAAVARAHADCGAALGRLERALPGAERRCAELLAAARRRDPGGAVAALGAALRALEQEQLALVHRLELRPADCPRAALEALARRLDELEARRAAARAWAARAVAEAQERLLARVAAARAETELVFERLAREAAARQARIAAAMDAHFADNQLQRVERRIAEAQRAWAADVRFFRERYIQGALQGVQDRVAAAFEKGLQMDAANVLHRAETLARQARDRLSEQREAQQRRRVAFAREARELEARLRRHHAAALREAAARVEAVQGAARRATDALDARLRRADALVGAAEFRDRAAAKLDKADVDIAYSVTCPGERHEPNRYVETAGMATTRVGGAALNVGAAGRPLGAHWARHDGLLLRVEEALNRLGFGRAPSPAGARRERELRRRVRSARRALAPRRPWRAGALDLDEYVAAFQREFGRPAE